MLNASNEFKQNILRLGRQIDVEITYGEQILYGKDIVSCAKEFDGSLYSTIMQFVNVELEGYQEIENQTINIKLGVSYNGGTFSYVDFGEFIVDNDSIEKIEETQSTKFSAYDLMYKSCKDYDSTGIIFPCTVKEYFESICNKSGLQYLDSSFPNSDKIVVSDPFENVEVTYRDVLDYIAQLSGRNIFISSGKAIIRACTISNVKLDEQNLSSLKVGKKWGPVNSLVLSRKQQEDNIYINDENSINEYGLTEVKISDNYIIDQSPLYREQFMNELFDEIKYTNYTVFESDSFGYGYLEPCDVVTLVDLKGNEYLSIVLKSSLQITTGISEKIYFDLPNVTTTDYNKATKTERSEKNAYLFVDKKLNEITSSVKETVTKVEEVSKRETISKISSQYGVSNSKDEAPIEWLDERPNIAENQWLWMREKYTYFDSTVKYDGERMISAENGTDGKGIVNVIPWYAISTSSTTAPTSGWVANTIPVHLSTEYVWQKEQIAYTDNTSNYTSPVCKSGIKGDKGDPGEKGLQGLQGEQGIQGIPGPKGDAGKQGIQGEQGPQGEKGETGASGTNGKTSYFHIKYSAVQNPTASSQMSETPNVYIGTYVDYNETDSTDPKAYTWYRFQGLQGNDGEQGIPGTNGTNGQTSYLHIAYSTSADGKTGFSVSDSTNKTYIGQYTDFVSADSTDPTKYSWTKIKGEQGIQGPQGPQGDIGPTGKGIKATSITYQAGTSGTTAPTGTWGTTIPTVTQGQYLWSRTVITYTDSTTSTTYSVAYIPKNGATGNTGAQGPMGPTGNTGATGTGIDTITQQYYLSTSKTAQSGGSWVTSMPTWSSGKYLWTRYAITYKNPTSTAYTSPVCDSSWEAVNEIQIGGRNLIKGTSSDWKQSNVGIYYNVLRSYDGSLMESGEVYTASIDIDNIGTKDILLRIQFYNDEADRTSVFGTNVPIGEKKKCICTFTYPNKIYKQIDFCMDGNSNIAITSSLYNYKCMKLEKGNKATDWTPAPEDLQQDITDAVDQATVSITESYTSLIDETSKEINLMVEKLTEVVDGNTETMASINNQLQITSEMAQFIKTTTEQLQDAVDGKLDATEIKEWARFDGAQLELGTSDSPFRCVLTNTELGFWQGDTEVAWFKNNEMHVLTAVITSSIGVGNLRLVDEGTLGYSFMLGGN